MLPILVALSPCSDPKGNSMFVHPGCTNSGLNAPGDLPESIVCQRIPGPVPRSRLLGLCHGRSYSLFVRSMSSSFLSNRIGKQSPGPARISLPKRRPPVCETAPLSAKANLTGIVGCFGLAKLIGARPGQRGHGPAVAL
jgi:hypothetical protein